MSLWRQKQTNARVKINTLYELTCPSCHTVLYECMTICGAGHCICFECLIKHRQKPRINDNCSLCNNPLVLKDIPQQLQDFLNKLRARIIARAKGKRVTDTNWVLKRRRMNTTEEHVPINEQLGKIVEATSRDIKKDRALVLQMKKSLEAFSLYDAYEVFVGQLRADETTASIVKVSRARVCDPPSLPTPRVQ